MPKGKPIEPNTKAEIVAKIRNEGLTVADASATYDVSAKSIYTWIKEGVVDSDRNLVLELNKLRKENEQLYKLLGRATAEMRKSKS